MSSTFTSKEEMSVTMLCEMYPRFFYPKGYGFYSTICLTRFNATKGLSFEQMIELMNVEECKKRVDDMISFFACTQEQVLKWVEDDINDGNYDWLDEEEHEGKTMQEKVMEVITYENNMGWSYYVASGADEKANEEWKRNIISAIANTNLTAVLSNVENSESVLTLQEEKKVREICNVFIAEMKKEKVQWMKELVPFIKKNALF